MNRVKKNIATSAGEKLLRTSIESKLDNEPNNDDDDDVREREREKTKLWYFDNDPSFRYCGFTSHLC